jgi:hypothetical protein
LPRRKLVIERGDLVQPIDEPLVTHRGGVATTGILRPLIQ